MPSFKPKDFGLGIIVGRFQILHKGHAQVIEEGLRRCQEFAIFVGSAQEAGTSKNPFSYEERKAFLNAAFPDAKVFPLNDIGVGNNCKWGEYVIKTVEDIYGKKPDVLFSGEESRRIAWLDPEFGVGAVFVPKEIDISSTQMKQYLLEGNRAAWNDFSVPVLSPKFDEIRQKIIETKDISNTQSI
ncbi:MAG: adenylyltransferase/cytidyltransferase family protein [Bacillota bacterium]|nr:adenylyltransferase/cytidyltransferase family protein [Bacillota bacterium]